MSEHNSNGVTKDHIRAMLGAQDAQDGGSRRVGFDQRVAWDEFAENNPLAMIILVAIGATLFVHVLGFLSWDWYWVPVIVASAVAGHFSLIVASRWPPDSEGLFQGLAQMYVAAGRKLHLILFPMVSALFVVVFCTVGGITWFVVYFLYLFWMITLPILGFIVFAVIVAKSTIK